MKTCLVRAFLLSAVLLTAMPVTAQIRAFDASRANRLPARLHEVDFEDLDLRPRQGLFNAGLPNPLIVDEVVFTDPFTLRGGICTSPTCEPDPDNSGGNNNELFLNPGAIIAFPTKPVLVVMDVQGIGDNPFTLTVTDARGHKKLVRTHGVLFGKTVIGLFSIQRIAKVEVKEVGGTGGPIALARVLYSKPPFKSPKHRGW